MTFRPHRVTLSFDNGPTLGVTDAVVDMLDSRGISAWFFPVGVQLAADRSSVQRAHDHGHSIGNHSMTHTVPLGECDDGAARAEILDAEAVIGELASSPKVFRPFGRGGELGPHLLGMAAVDVLIADGFTVALWNNVPGDWYDPTGWVERCLATFDAHEWSVVVLHDIADACLARLGEFLDELLRRGAEFTVELPGDCTPIVAGRRTAADILLGLDRSEI